MTGSDRAIGLLAFGIAVLMGYVDAFGFLKSGGYFVSMMAGNTTHLGVTAGRGGAQTWPLLVIIGLFVLGVIAGSLTGRMAKDFHRPAVLGLCALVLGATAGLSLLTLTSFALIGSMTFAMGAINTVFEQDGRGQPQRAPTMTGRQRSGLAVALGAEWLSWRHQVFLWAGFVAGALCGALVYSHSGMTDIWIAAAFAALLAMVSGWTPGPGRFVSQR
jgi:uncharacterized membrane protein YoaK (UPF0700 family)